MSAVSVLIVSCDRYADLWTYFFTLFQRRWPDCPFPVFLGSNALTANERGVESITVGPDTSWSMGVRRMLDGLVERTPGTEYVLLMLEDFLLTAPVDSARVVALATRAREHGIGCLRLVADLPLAIAPRIQFSELDGVGPIDSGEPYRVTLQAALWRISTLRSLLVPGMTAWDFETIGSQMSEAIPDPFWGVTTTVLHYDHVLEKGKWKPDGLRILTDAGLPLPAAGRPAFSEDEFAAHLRKGQLEAERSAQRSDALRSFLRGRRREGIRSLRSYGQAAGLGAAEIALGIAGIVGPAATRRLLALHVASKIRECAGRERPAAPAKGEAEE